ncbi:Telomerase Cajal body protein 1 [Dissophora globulifera]|uniref:Telomerase Cajal body protein 1 n=1 Tax=Dissophora globulifera TaxID=979702 RepID=A0A9P6UMB1_9FUNG|nr:Telomerase Cajal body protein 1 [Dissophora globulifera]
MNSQDPSTCCVLSSSRDHPVHLWDAYTGELRCSYTILDHCEVNVAPTALCFNLDGSKIYCGSNNMVEIFDTTRPGRDSQKRPTVRTRKSRKGQKGVISCLAFNPDQSDLYAAGSFLKTIGLYDSRADELLLLLRDKGNNTSSNSGGNRARRQGEMGGVTHLQFSPDGQYLYSASRQDPWIRCWDIRDTTRVLYRLERPGELTNQRIGFDISSDGRWLTTGDMNGDISVFDLGNPTDTSAERLVARLHGHDDVISAATFHPSGSILATCSGQRKYDMDLEDGSDTDMSSSSEEDEPLVSDVSTSQEKVLLTNSLGANDGARSTIDNSIKLWTLPGDYAWYLNGQRYDGASSGGDYSMETADLDPPEGVTLSATAMEGAAVVESTL